MSLRALVKADGYGHGAAAAARAALDGGAGWIAVATAREAHALRRAGIEARLLIMGAMTHFTTADGDLEFVCQYHRDGEPTP